MTPGCFNLLVVLVLPILVASFTPSPTHHLISLPQPTPTKRQLTHRHIFGSSKKQQPSDERTYPESKPATYDLLPSTPFEFGPTGIVRPLLLQTQLQNRPLQVVYNAQKDGWDARAFHKKVDGKGASVVLAKVRGQWIGGYNPRGWASLGGSRPSIASFLFYQKFFSWQKLRVSRTGGMACGRDEFDQGIYFGSDALVIPLNRQSPRNVASRLGYFFECGPEGRSTLLPVKGQDSKLDELYVISGVYEKDEDIPNSGGVTDLGLY